MEHISVVREDNTKSKCTGILSIRMDWVNVHLQMIPQPWYHKFKRSISHLQHTFIVGGLMPRSMTLHV